MGAGGRTLRMYWNGSVSLTGLEKDMLGHQPGLERAEQDLRWIDWAPNRNVVV